MTTMRKLSFTDFHLRRSSPPPPHPGTLNLPASPTSSAPKKGRHISFSGVRKVNKFNFIVGAISNKQRDDTLKAIKQNITVSLDPSTIAILSSLHVDPKKPADGKLKRRVNKKRRRKGSKLRNVLTNEEHCDVARQLALKYTRDVHTLNTFEALEEDRRRLAVLRHRLGEERMREAKQSYLESVNQAIKMIEESGSENDTDADTETDDEGESREIIGHLSHSAAGGTPRSPKTSKISPRFASEAMPGGSSPKRKQSSLLLLKSPLERHSQRHVKSPLNLKHPMTPTPHAPPSSASAAACASAPPATPATPATPLSRRRTTVALTNGRVRIMSSPTPPSRGVIGTHSPDGGKVGPVGGSPIDNSRPSFDHHHKRQNPVTSFSSRPTFRKASSKTIKKEEGEFTDSGFYRCSLDDRAESSDEDSFFRELDGFKGDSTGENDVPVVVELASNGVENSKDCDYKNNGVSDDDDHNDDMSLSSASTSSSTPSMMLDIDIVQSRLLQKQAVKAAAAEEKRKEESENTRKRKADPRECASQAAVLLPGYQLGDSWVEKFAHLMGARVRKVDLSNSNISKLGVNALFRSILPSLRSLTLKQVDLSQSMKEIESFLSSNDRCHLLELNVAETKLGNINCSKLCVALSNTGTVNNLDLSGNMISAVGCEAIAKMLEKVSLQRLSLGWNKVDGQAATSLFKALASHQSLLALDVSWNSIGTFPTPHKSSLEGMAQLCGMIAHSSSLFHLNLSANKFSEEDCKKLANVLHSNTTICGLHFDHNPGAKVDTKGYLRVAERDGEGDAEHGILWGHRRMKTTSPPSRRISSVTGYHTTHNELSYEGSTCWCCGQWVEVEFEFKQPWVDDGNPEDVFLRLSIDDWRKDKMLYEGNCRWTLSRMVPRITITYCFSLRKDDWESDVFCPDQPKCLNSAAPTATVNFLSLEDIDICHADVEFERHYEPSINGHYKEENVVWPFFSEILPMHVVHHETNPRLGGWAEENVAPKWTLESSKLLGTRKKENHVHSYWDTEQLLGKAFACDWGYLVPKLVKMKMSEEDIQNLGGFLSKHYRKICILYKRNVVLHQNKTFNLSMIAFEQFLSSCDITDRVAVKKRDIDRIFISTTAEKVKAHQQAGLERFEFVEALVRVAILKFLDSQKGLRGDVATVANAFRLLFSDHLKFCFCVDPDDFRKEHFYSSECERILTVHVHNIRTIFNQYALINGGSKGRFMSIEEFHMFLDHSMLIEKNLITHNDASICFVESKFLIPDELKSVEHHSISFLSFLECICRMAFQVDNNKQRANKAFGFDLGDIILEAQKRTKFRGILIDDFMTKVVIGLRECGVHFFNKTLKVIFSDEDAAMKKCAKVVQQFVRRWRLRKRLLRQKEGQGGGKAFQDALKKSGR
ncbi:hypothetical protein TrCOL_g10432 [Triparma columacea]|uniref:Uncharacterized protein n=1 Tax=Triparma columacea TaxID=722753 RepID=A0A9W7L918_9STRA|nr:hypothetical protein TrCOL_g10432 [Triparma columacea]